MDIDNLYPKVVAEDAGGREPPSTGSNGNRKSDEGQDGGDRFSADAPRQAAQTLLPLLLTTPPYIPSSLKSKDVNRRHNILNLTPENADEYLVTSYATHPEGTSAHVVELLGELRAQVEQLHGIYAAGDSDAVVGTAGYKNVGFGEVVAAVPLGDVKQASAPLLTVLLKVEGPGDKSSSFKFDNLLPHGAATGPWKNHLADVVGTQPSTSPGDNQDERPASRTRSDSQLTSFSSSTAPRSIRTTNSFQTALSDAHSPGVPASGFRSAQGSRSPSVRHPTAQAEANDGQQIDAEYITDPAEFWGGFGDDDEADKEDGQDKEKDDGVDGAVDDEAAERAKEDAYWAMYETQDEETRDEPYQFQFARSDRIDDADHRNLDKLQQVQEQHWIASASADDGADSSVETTTIKPRAQPAPLVLPDDAETSNGDERTEEGTVRSRGPSSPRSDETDSGISDTGDRGGENDDTTASKRKKLSSIGAAMTTSQNEAAASMIDVATANAGMMLENGHEDASKIDDGLSENDEPKPAEKGKGRDGNELGDIGLSGSRTQQDQGPRHGRAGSVSMYSTSGQSYFETPADMDLKDLEDFYRNRDLQRSLEQRERIQRASYPELFVDYKTRENAFGLPGLENTSQAKTAGDLKAGQRDPITALAFAEPAVAVAGSHAHNPSGRPLVPRHASMDTLRKLVEQSATGSDTGATPEMLRRRQAAQGISTSKPSEEGSKAGKHNNFLNLAPSVMSDSDVGDEMETRSMSLNVPPSVAEELEEEEDIGADEQGQKQDEPGDDGQHDEGYDFDDGKSVIGNDAVDQAGRPSLLRRRLDSRPSEPGSANGLLRGQTDLDEFMFPGLIKPSKRPALDSPHASESDPLVKEVAESFRTNSHGRILAGDQARNARGEINSVAPSDTFLPGAASDASMMPLTGSLTGNSSLQRRGSDGGSSVVHLRDGESIAVGDRASEIRSTDTDLGLGDEDKGAAWPTSTRPTIRAGLQEGRWPKGAGPGPGSLEPPREQQGPRQLRASPSAVHTAHLMQEHLKQQRQQALQVQRERIQAQRNEKKGAKEREASYDDRLHGQDPDGISQSIPTEAEGEEEEARRRKSHMDLSLAHGELNGQENHALGNEAERSSDQNWSAEHMPTRSTQANGRVVEEDRDADQTREAADDGTDVVEGESRPEVASLAEDAVQRQEDLELQEPLPLLEGQEPADEVAEGADFREITRSSSSSELTIDESSAILPNESMRQPGEGAFDASNTPTHAQAALSPSKRDMQLPSLLGTVAEKEDEGERRRENDLSALAHPQQTALDRQAKGRPSSRQQLQVPKATNSQSGNAEQARRRREAMRVLQSRNEAAKSILKGAYRLMDEVAIAVSIDAPAGSASADAGGSRVSETEFLRLAREAFRECQSADER